MNLVAPQRRPVANTREFRFALLRSTAQLLAAQAAWDRLWIAAQAPYVLGFRFAFESWNCIHQPQGAALCCAVAYDAQRLVAVLPMVLRRRKLWMAATTGGPRAAENCDILIEPGPRSPALATALVAEFCRLARPDFIEWDFVKAGSHLDLALQGNPGLHVARAVVDPCPYAELGTAVDWDSHLASLGKSYRSKVARKERRLQQLGRVAFEVLQGAPEPMIDWLFEHKRKWSERTNKRGDWVDSPHYQQFLRRLFASGPGFLVFVMTLDGAPIAVKLVALGGRSACLVMMTYDERYQEYSVGNVLDEFMMRTLFEHHRAADGRHLDVDFGPGLERYKLHWSRDHRLEARSFAVAATPWGRARFGFQRWIARLRRGSSAAAGARRAPGAQAGAPPLDAADPLPEVAAGPGHGGQAR